MADSSSPKSGFSPATLSFASGAVSDLFAGFGAKQSSKMAAAGLNLQASGLRIKAQGDLAEAQSYGLASGLAEQNKQYVIESTAIQQAQLDRQINLAIGGQRADIAGAGLKESGTALDLLADSAAQGALAHEVLAKQGLITEAGYEEQAKSYDVMAGAARMAASGEMSLAAQTDALAQQTIDAGKKQAEGDFISAAVKGAAALAPAAEKIAPVILAMMVGGLRAELKMLAPSRIVALPLDYQEFIEQVRSRVVDLGAPHQIIEQHMELTPGYLGKLLGAAQVRNIGLHTVWRILDGIGYRIALVEHLDLEAAIDEIKEYRTKIVPGSPPGKMIRTKLSPA